MLTSATGAPPLSEAVIGTLIVKFVLKALGHWMLVPDSENVTSLVGGGVDGIVDEGL